MTSAGSAGEMDYHNYYDLESYLFRTVGPRFRDSGQLSALDFFCIVIWKANRAKSRIAARLLRRGHPNLHEAVFELTRGIAKQGTPTDKLRYLLEDWRFRLPMASAILTVLYPDEFTIYDTRVCALLGEFANLGSINSFERLWRGYKGFIEKVRQQAPDKSQLRDKDRYLWGKSFYEQLAADIERRFSDNELGVKQ